MLIPLKCLQITASKQEFMVYITTPVILSCFLAFFSDPYSLFENFIFLSFYVYWYHTILVIRVSEKTCISRAVGSYLTLVRLNQLQLEQLQELIREGQPEDQLKSVNHTSMRSMLLLGGLRACFPRRILKNRCSEIVSEST